MSFAKSVRPIGTFLSFLNKECTMRTMQQHIIIPIQIWETALQKLIF